MSMLLDIIFIMLTMMGAFFLVFLLMFLFAMMLAPIELSLSKIVWGKPKTTVPAQPARGSFKEFSKKTNR